MANEPEIMPLNSPDGSTMHDVPCTTCYYFDIEMHGICAVEFVYFVVCVFKRLTLR